MSTQLWDTAEKFRPCTTEGNNPSTHQLGAFVTGNDVEAIQVDGITEENLWNREALAQPSLLQMPSGLAEVRAVVKFPFPEKNPNVITRSWREREKGQSGLN